MSNPIVTTGPLPERYYPMPELGYTRIGRITATYAQTLASPLTFEPTFTVVYFNIEDEQHTLRATGASATTEEYRLGLGEQLGDDYPYVARATPGLGREISGPGGSIRIVIDVPVYADEVITIDGFFCTNRVDPTDPRLQFRFTVSGNAELGTSWWSATFKKGEVCTAIRLTAAEYDDWRFPVLPLARPWDAVAQVTFSNAGGSFPVGDFLNSTGFTVTGISVNGTPMAQLPSPPNSPRGISFEANQRQIVDTPLYDNLNRINRLVAPMQFGSIFEDDTYSDVSCGIAKFDPQATPGFIEPIPLTEPGIGVITSVPQTAVQAVPNGHRFSTVTVYFPCRMGDTIEVLNGPGGPFNPNNDGNTTSRIVVRDGLNPQQGEMYLIMVYDTRTWALGETFIFADMTTQIGNWPGIATTAIYPGSLQATGYCIRTNQPFTPSPGQIRTDFVNIGERQDIAPVALQFLSDTPISDFELPNPPPSGCGTNGQCDGPPFEVNGIALDMRLLDYTWYSDIRGRGIQSRIPTHIFADGQFPTREVKLWYVPAQDSWVELWLWQPLNADVDLDCELNLPIGYERALLYSIACELAPEYGREVPPVLDALKEKAVAAVSRKNIDVPHPRRDSRLPSRKDGQFNWITGRSGPDNWNV